MTMIEKVANALREAENNIDPWPTSKQDYLNRLAEAAIKAMRHPTKEMIIAGWSCFNTELELPLTRYRAMIEAALNDIPDPEQN